MKKKLLLFGLLLAFVFTQCNQKEKPLDANVLKAKIRASQDFKNYENSTRELLQSTISGEISLEGVNKKAMKEALKNSKSAEDYAKKLESEGVKGSKKLAELLFQQNESSLNIIKNYHSELKRISRSEFGEIFKISPETNTSIINTKK